MISETESLSFPESIYDEEPSDGIGVGSNENGISQGLAPKITPQYYSRVIQQHAWRMYALQQFHKMTNIKKSNTIVIEDDKEPEIETTNNQKTPKNGQESVQLLSNISLLSSNDLTIPVVSEAQKQFCFDKHKGAFLKAIKDGGIDITDIPSDSIDGKWFCKWSNCSKSNHPFNSRFRLVRHMLVHTGAKPHACDICPKTFSRLENLKIHRRVHTGEKPYGCREENCQKRFSNSSDRIKHERTHKINKYKCPSCDYICLTPMTIAKHHRKVHGTKLPKESTSCRVDSIE